MIFSRPQYAALRNNHAYRIAQGLSIDQIGPVMMLSDRFSARRMLVFEISDLGNCAVITDDGAGHIACQSLHVSSACFDADHVQVCVPEVPINPDLCHATYRLAATEKGALFVPTSVAD